MKHASPLRFHGAPEGVGALLSPWHAAVAPKAGLQASVIIPAKDEADSIGATLAALAAQTDLQGRPLPFNTFEVLLLANNCQDQTAAIARKFAAQQPKFQLYVAELTLPAKEAHVGRARRLLMDEACQRLERAGHPQAFIASTDADTIVAPTWLAATAAELERGADAVGGRILTNHPDARCPVRRCQLQDATYHVLRAQLECLLDPADHDPWPRHHQHFGASLAITATAYRQVGGLPVVPFLEDEALYQALLRHDLCLRHSPAVRVCTSARQQGRVAVGLSWQLRQWSDLQQAQQEPNMEHPARLVAECKLRHQLRQVWPQVLAGSPLRKVAPGSAAAAGMTNSALQREMQQATTFGQLWEAVREHFARYAAKRWSALPLSVALQELRHHIAQLSPNKPILTSIKTQGVGSSHSVSSR